MGTVSDVSESAPFLVRAEVVSLDGSAYLAV